MIEDPMNPVPDLQRALLHLQTPSSPIDLRMVSLRFIQRHVSDPANNIDARLRKNINQLVLNNVLNIALSDDRIVDLHRRQLIRAECFLILGTLLSSDTLFAGVNDKIRAIQQHNAQIAAERAQEGDNSTNRDDYSLTTLDTDDDSLSLALEGDYKEGNEASEYKSSSMSPTRMSMSAGNGDPSSTNRADRSRIRSSNDDGNVEEKYGTPVKGAAGTPGASRGKKQVTLENPVHSGRRSPARTPGSGKRRGGGTGSTNKGMSPGKPRPSDGPPGGWVREEKNEGLSSFSPLGAKDATSPQGILRSPTAETRMTLSRSSDMTNLTSRSNRASFNTDLAYSKSSTDLSLLKSTLTKAPKHLLKDKRLRPRPSGFNGGAYELDGFAPGVDPTDWFEQDKRLGYQKPRMWFPLPGESQQGLIPGDRTGARKQIRPDDIVKEFLQMRSLLTYVSDLIHIPYTNKSKKLTRTRQGRTLLDKQGTDGEIRPFRRLEGVLQNETYKDAILEAVQVWSPLVGAHLPRWARKAQQGGQLENNYGLMDISKSNQHENAQYESAKKLGDVYGERPMERAPWLPSPEKIVVTALNKRHAASEVAGGTLEKKVLYTKGMLRKLLTKEIQSEVSTRETFQETMSTLLHNEFLSKKQVKKSQKAITDSLQETQDIVQKELSMMTRLMRETVTVQYASLPARFLLLVEGEKSKPRKLVESITNIYCRVRAFNFLNMAFGIWKAHIVLEESKKLYPIYARYAACHLMKEWATTRKFRQMKKQLAMWRENIARLILVQRNKCALPIQTLYRKFRDRCLIMRLHMMGFFFGPLSDIELGEWRENIKFKIPRAIRDTRREIWFGVVKIQTLYRKWIVYRHTLKRRRQVVLLQSVIRMFPKREKYKRLRFHTVRMQAYIRRNLAVLHYAYMKVCAVRVQKYVRRYLKQCWKWKVFDKAWAIQEKRLGAAILIQCRYREYCAKKRIWRIKNNIKEREWACLVLQRRWFKKKKAFHTFVLMCCLRAAEKEDAEFQKYINSLGRYYQARKIQRRYTKRFFKRNITAAIKIQCRYRAYHGYNLMETMRREKWASRRVRHFARGWLRRRHRSARKIQRLWWSRHPGNLRKHLRYHARRIDEIEDHKVVVRQFFAASRIISLAKMVLTRQWYKQTKAAMVIQKGCKFWVARLGWRRLKQMRNRTVVNSYVQSVISSMVERRKRAIIAHHSKLAIRPQALARGFLLRCKWKKSVNFANRYARAVLTIQRAIRRSGAMAVAVAEIMARKRDSNNPFNKCSSIHKLINTCYDRCSQIFSVRDPRVGLKFEAFLYRLGLMELKPMFSAKYSMFTDYQSQGLVMDDLVDMYKEMYASKVKEMARQGARKIPPIQVPHKQLQALIDHAAPSLLPRAPSEVAVVQQLLAFAENDVVTPNSIANLVQKKFIKKFGHSQSNRAINLGNKCKEWGWLGYNNFKMCGKIVTPAMVERALEDCTEGQQVQPLIDSMIASYHEQLEAAEKKWDMSRVATCAEVMQLACEAMRKLLCTSDITPTQYIWGKNPIADIVERANTRVLNYQRRFANNKDKLVAKGFYHIHPTENMSPQTIKGFHFKWALSPAEHDSTLSVIDSVDLPYTGSKDRFVFEENISKVKIFQEAFDKLRAASSGIQGLKNKWFVYTVHRAITKARAARFLEVQQEGYMFAKHNNHVKDHWEEFKKKDAVRRKLNEILKEVEAKKAIIRDVLSKVLRYGWTEKVDDNGYAYYQDTLDRGYDPTYDFQGYTLDHWNATSLLQSKTRDLLHRIRERIRIKEEAKAAEMARIEALWKVQVEAGRKGAKLSIVHKAIDIQGMITSMLVKKEREAIAAQEAKERALQEEKEVEESGRASSTKAPQQSTDTAPSKTSEGGVSALFTETTGGKAGGATAAVDPSLFAEGSSAALGGSKKPAAPGTGAVGAGDEEVELYRPAGSSLEGQIPWKFQFQPNPTFASGQWALLRTPIPKKTPPSAPTGEGSRPTTKGSDGGNESKSNSRVHTAKTGSKPNTATKAGTPGKKEMSKKKKKKKSRGYGKWAVKKQVEEALVSPYLAKSEECTYELVVTYNFRSRISRKSMSQKALQQQPPGNVLCDAKTYYGKTLTAIPLSRLYVMNYEVGSHVECRFDKSKYFYPGRITAIHTDVNQLPIYTILYDDGDIEHNVSETLLRPSVSQMDGWFHYRNKYIRDLVLYQRRLAHVTAIRNKRLERIYEKALNEYTTFVENYQPPSDTPKGGQEGDDSDAEEGDDEYVGGLRDMSRASNKEKAARRDSVARRGSVTPDKGRRQSNAGNKKDSRRLSSATASLLSQADDEIEEELQQEVEAVDPIVAQAQANSRFWFDQSFWAAKADEVIQVEMQFTKMSYQYGWVEHRWKSRDPGKDGEWEVGFKHALTNKVTKKPPNFRPEHDFNARKIQKNWNIHRSRRFFRSVLYSEPLETVIENSITKYQKHAFVGYEDEGTTLMMYIRRCGFDVVASCIEEKYKYRQKEMKQLTIEGIINTPTDLYERLGINGAEKVKSMKDFQAWYNKVPPLTRKLQTCLLNYYDDHRHTDDDMKTMIHTQAYVIDARPMRDVINERGLVTIRDKFLKQFPQSTSRTVMAVKSMLKSNYPHTLAMVDNYIKRYADKAEVARDNIGELANIPIVSSYIDEKQAFQVLYGATRRIHAIVANMKMLVVRDTIAAAEAEALSYLQSLEVDQEGGKSKDGKDSDKKGRRKGQASSKGEDSSDKPNTPGKPVARQLGPGPEGRATLVLRVRVMQYMRNVIASTIIIQTRVRAFVKYRTVNRTLKTRRNAATTIQRVIRGTMDRLIAEDLREQQASIWEQLWDGTRELVYYYNRNTEKSTYMEPAEAYRPLVRDRLSQSLVQAWPFLDEDKMAKSTALIPAAEGATVSKPGLALCCYCNVRKCVRLCVDCPHMEGMASSSAGPKLRPVTPYCFPCYTLAHSTDETETHRYEDADESLKKEEHLICCMCTELPATRKCLGILDDETIDTLCTTLAKTVPSKWPSVLESANVGGERKLTMLLEQIGGSSSSVGHGTSYLNPMQIQSVRAMLERTRAECDEVYCDECYIEVHSGGKRSLHKWVGFRPHAVVCSVCNRNAAETTCRDCDSNHFCKSCWRVFHSMGRKRKHKTLLLCEIIELGEDYCCECQRRVATQICPNILHSGEDGRCNKRFCNSCYECQHVQPCTEKATAYANKELLYASKRNGNTSLPPNIADESCCCCICGEVATIQCQECGDLYCETNVMDREECFKSMHSKGNRCNHTPVSLESLKDPMANVDFGKWANM